MMYICIDLVISVSTELFFHKFLRENFGYENNERPGAYSGKDGIFNKTTVIGKLVSARKCSHKGRGRAVSHYHYTII